MISPPDPFLWFALLVAVIALLVGVHVLGLTSRLRKLEKLGIDRRHKLFHTLMFPK